jgi:Family of unknown function (DUF6191)
MGWLWAMSLPGLACLLVLLVALERLGLWFSGHSWLPWRWSKRPVSAAALDEVTALFYATKHHELQQRRTELMLREEAGDGAPRAMRLDLDHGTPTIVVAP